MSGPISTLELRRTLGLCSRCCRKLMPHEKELEGVGGSYVRCDRCTNEIVSGRYQVSNTHKNPTKEE